jgi:hypothetical protein
MARKISYTAGMMPYYTGALEAHKYPILKDNMLFVMGSSAVNAAKYVKQCPKRTDLSRSVQLRESSRKFNGSWPIVY